MHIQTMKSRQSMVRHAQSQAADFSSWVKSDRQWQEKMMKDGWYPDQRNLLRLLARSIRDASPEEFIIEIGHAWYPLHLDRLADDCHETVPYFQSLLRRVARKRAFLATRYNPFDKCIRVHVLIDWTKLPR